MKPTIRIAQLTDCHLMSSPEQDYRGKDSQQSLQRLMQSVREFAPELLLATGDLSEDASPASYKALQGNFEPLGIPVLALPGNHDDPALLAKTFNGSPVGNVEISQHGDWQIIRIDSTVPGTPAGRINTEALAELEQVLSQQPDRLRLIALHHQPVPVGSPWIDKYRLLEPEGFLQLIDQCAGIKAVVWGHTHQVFTQQRNGIAMLGSPSSVINSLPTVQNFTASELGPAFRWLELGGNGMVRTGIIAAESIVITLKEH